MIEEIFRIFFVPMIVCAILASLRNANIIKVEDDSHSILKIITGPFWHLMTFMVIMLFISDRTNNYYLFPVETVITQFHKHGFYEGGLVVFLASLLQYFWVLVGFGLSSRNPKKYVLYNLVIGLIFLVVMNEWKNYELGL